MLSFFDSFRDINTVNILFRMVFAVICGGVIGIERSIKNRPAGFRTHILIITGATAASLTGHYVYLVMGLPRTWLYRRGHDHCHGRPHCQRPYHCCRTLGHRYHGPCDRRRFLRGRASWNDRDPVLRDRPWKDQGKACQRFPMRRQLSQ